MTCNYVRFADGSSAIVCGPRPRRQKGDAVTEPTTAALPEALLSPAVPYSEQLACMRLLYRKYSAAFAKDVAEGKMDAQAAQQQLATLEAVGRTLHTLAAAEAGQGRLL